MGTYVQTLRFSIIMFVVASFTTCGELNLSYMVATGGNFRLWVGGWELECTITEFTDAGVQLYW